MSCVNTKQPAKVSVVIPTFRRSQQLATCLNQLMSCDPVPAEILVHIDYGDNETESFVRRSFPSVLILKSESRQGPGGGRNKLIKAATNELVASFDDDSFPIDKNFFQRAIEHFETHPDLSILGCRVFEQHETVQTEDVHFEESSVFAGGACIYRKSHFLNTDGYLPLVTAYGMEEADLSLQILNLKGTIARTNLLRVFHDTNLERHASKAINAAHITNTALLVFLRYPLHWLPYGCLQVANRVIYACRVKRYRGIVSGLLAIPTTCWRYRKLRKPVTTETLRLVRRIRSSPQPLNLPKALTATN